MAAAGYAEGVKAKLNTNVRGSTIRVNEVWTEQVRTAVGNRLRVGDPGYRRHGDAECPKPPLTPLPTGRRPLLPTRPRSSASITSRRYKRTRKAGADPRLEELMVLQAMELDSTKRLEVIKEITELLQQGESHFVPLVWAQEGGGMDYRLQNYTLAPTKPVLAEVGPRVVGPGRQVPRPRGLPTVAASKSLGRWGPGLPRKP